LIEFQSREVISLQELKEMVLSWYEPFKIYTTKLNGRNMVREMYSVQGPSGNVKYNYGAKGYMILFDEDSLGYRTIVWKNVEKIVKDNRTYFVR
jgi:hypothetical protein